jgi:HSP20 family protein
MLSPFRGGTGIWDLQSEMDRLFDNVVGDLFGGRRRRGDRALTESASAVFAPPLEAYAHDGDLVLHADLPGVAIEDVDITLQDAVLTISGTRKSGAPEGVTPYLRELPYGEFTRSIRVPEDVAADAIKARLENGVLEVVLPGAVTEAQPKRIAIESGEGREGRTIDMEEG